MINPLAQRLSEFTRLSVPDLNAIDTIAARRVRRLRANDDLIREGEPPRTVFLMLTGWACRYKTLEDGRRQIVAFFVPGDLCDLNIFVLREMDHSLGAITPGSVAEISREEFDVLSTEHPRVLQALWWNSLVTMAIQREWTVNLGQRTAYERLAHLFCELFLRLRGVGLTSGDKCQFPLTQNDLADATGLTAVHVNRTLQELRRNGLVELGKRELRIPDLDALMRAGLFNPNYLHLEREGRHLDANE